MPNLASQYKEELLREIEGLSAEKMKELIDFTYFIKAKDAIDPSQAYFWSTKWQRMEAEVEDDKKAGRIIGDGSVEGLLNELKG